MNATVLEPVPYPEENPMPDRVFAAFLLLVTLGYTALALFVIEAPFQYDPLGPESWPRILGAVMLVCLVLILARPDVHEFDVDRPSWVRLAAVLALLVAYAALFEPLGFIISTALFSLATARLLGADWLRAAIFGVAAGVGGYLLCVGLLGLNLPAGPLPRL
jgi:putative tricarboxylic transport membrane protein